MQQDEPKTAYQGHSHWGVIDAQRARVAAHAQESAAAFRRDMLSDAMRAHFDARDRERDEWAAAGCMTHTQARAEAARALDELACAAIEAGADPVDSAMSESDIRMMAKRRARLMGERIDAKVFATAGPTDARALLAWLNGELARFDLCARFQGSRPEGEQLAGVLARVRCELWWRRKVRRAVVRLREHEGVLAGEIGAMGGRSPYVTNDTNRRMQQRREDGKSMLAATFIENADGYSLSLEQAAEKSTANPAIRRGELMTRVVGCERIADTLGHAGVFLTMTAPSRFHSKGGRNPRYKGAKPRESHEWLCKTWERLRAKLGRVGLRFYGFRVAEPHRDACAHWHAMFWCEPERMDELVALVREWWVRECDPSPWHVVHAKGCANARDSDLCLFSDPGRAKYRVNAKPIEAGGAAGYCAKYISKNIDDKGVDGHIDHDGEDPAPKAVHGGTARRVLTWAQAHGIRQFQPLGQPPVTVWRELRRVIEAKNHNGATGRMASAFEAVNRKGERRASWALYVIAQGGLMRGRLYKLRIATETLRREGRYETTEQPRPVGVFDVDSPNVWHLSNRQEWKPKGTWGERAKPAPARRIDWKSTLRGGWIMSPENERLLESMPADEAAQAARELVVPWTRVNNCTDRRPLMSLGLVGLAMKSIEPGGSNTERNSPCPIPTPKPPPAPLPMPSPT